MNINDLPPDLQMIFNVGAKVYRVKTKEQGKVSFVDDQSISVDYGNKVKSQLEEYSKEDFSVLLLEDSIVAGSRLTLGSGDGFKIKPRLGQPVATFRPSRVEEKTTVKGLPTASVLTGYINEKTGKFSREKKKGYIKIEYRKATQKVTLEIDDETLSKLKEMGIV